MKVCSVAIPIVRTGPNCIPKEEIFEILKEEVEKRSSFHRLEIAKAKKLKRTSSSHSRQLSLRDIRVIVVVEQKEPPKLTQSVSSPLLQLPPPPLTNKPLRFGSVRVTLCEGDVTDHAADVTLNVIHGDLQLSSGGGVSRSILKVGGPAIQRELDTASKPVPKGSVVFTSAGSMKNVKGILHFVPNSTDIAGITASIEQCLHEARSRSLKRVSIPAIGTASFRIAPKSSAELILNAAKSFSKMDYQLQINIVVYQKSMMPDFEAVLQESAEKKRKAFQSLVRCSSDSTNQSSQARSSSDQVTTMMIWDSTEVMELLFVAADPRHIDESIEKVEKFIERSVTRKELTLLNINEKVKSNLPEIMKLGRENHVSIENSPSGKVSIIGLREDVSECVSRLNSLMADPVAGISDILFIKFLRTNDRTQNI